MKILSASISDVLPPLSSAWPAVSVFLTVRDEELHLPEAVRSILAQDYAGPLEVVVAVGPSRDSTWEVAQELAAREPRLTVVENPTGFTPAGLNLAVAAARHDVLVRVDGHSFLPPSYVSRVVDSLRRSGAANVGGLMVPEGRTAFEQAVAYAMSSPIGIGSVAFHTGGAEGPAESVYLGAFRRQALEAVGGFDETFLRAQDWELNYRLRQAGYVVWFDPELQVGYRPRGTWRALRVQFFRSGRWRRYVSQHHRVPAGFRYLAAPTAVAAMLAGALIAAAGLVLGEPGLLLGLAVPVAYVAFTVAAALTAGRALPARAQLYLPVVLATMHVAWGLGFLRGSERHAGVTGSVPAREKVSATL
jgi:glycosyltransferase involved in cell wall biosynthesis